jgi:ATP-dependent Clp protease ATP-binding subunit ClpB
MTRWRSRKAENAKMQELTKDLEKARRELVQAEKRSDFAKAGELKHSAIPTLEQALYFAEKKQKRGSSGGDGDGDDGDRGEASRMEAAVELQAESAQSNDAAGVAGVDTEEEEEEELLASIDGDYRSVTAEHVAEVVSRATGIPIRRLLQGERTKLLHLEDELRKSVVGQEHALNAVSECVRVSRAGLHSHDRPLGVFLFLGPSGVGKTELAKALCRTLFDDERGDSGSGNSSVNSFPSMTRIDMSEYMESHSVSRLIGAPPGYVGHEQGGELTEAVRRRPYQVVVFDEYEKAHRDVGNVLLQLCDEGYLTSAQGQRVDFRNCVLILTSNLGSRYLTDGQEPMKGGEQGDSGTGLDGLDPRVRAALQAHMPPELQNRLDRVIQFNHLGPEHMGAVVDLQLKRVDGLVRDRGLAGIEVTAAAKAWLAASGCDIMFGARPLRRLVDACVLGPLSKLVLSGEVNTGDAVLVDVDLAAANNEGNDSFGTPGLVLHKVPAAGLQRTE